jgi:Tfp pilus assembly protein PilO
MKLSKEKKSQLALVSVMIAVIATGLYMGLIRYQQAKLRSLDVEKSKVVKKLKNISESSSNRTKVEADLVEIAKELSRREDHMASGDLYASLVNSIRKFKLSYEVDIKQFSSKGAGPLDVIPKFPYEQFTVTIMGSAYYHDLGKFIADFENQFESSRVLNLELLADSAGEVNNQEKLNFRMDVVSLVKPGAPIKKTK